MGVVPTEFGGVYCDILVLVEVGYLSTSLYVGDDFFYRLIANGVGVVILVGCLFDFRANVWFLFDGSVDVFSCEVKLYCYWYFGSSGSL